MRKREAFASIFTQYITKEAQKLVFLQKNPTVFLIVLQKRQNNCFLQYNLTMTKNQQKTYILFCAGVFNKSNRVNNYCVLCFNTKLVCATF